MKQKRRRPFSTGGFRAIGFGNRRAFGARHSICVKCAHFMTDWVLQPSTRVRADPFLRVPLGNSGQFQSDRVRQPFGISRAMSINLHKPRLIQSNWVQHHSTRSSRTDSPIQVGAHRAVSEPSGSATPNPRSNRKTHSSAPVSIPEQIQSHWVVQPKPCSISSAR